MDQIISHYSSFAFQLWDIGNGIPLQLGELGKIHRYLMVHVQRQGEELLVKNRLLIIRNRNWALD
jgi:hypothetical protein